MSNDKYTPIDCGRYEYYELAIMHRQTLFVRWRGEDGVTHLEQLEPRDLRTRDSEEFLCALTVDGHERLLRLDRITEARRKT